MSDSHSHARLRVLLVVASYGEKNLPFLRSIIDRYRHSSMDVDIVVTSEAPKSVDLGVRVLVGTPTKNPYSLPFAHTKVFADNVDRYDLYVYSEDDIDVSDESLRAFVTLSGALQPHELAGFVRFEVGQDGTRHLPDVHGRFRWKPESVRRRGDFLIAEFTNEHTGFYVLTNDQLRRALASGAYCCSPYQGRYDMLESAATNVYVNCGFCKVIAISHLNTFLVHHMPNRYVGVLGLPLSAFHDQIEALSQIHERQLPTSTLCDVEPKLLQSRWGKRYDELPSNTLLAMVPPQAASVLSVGAGWGATELELLSTARKVTAFPLDPVVGHAAARQGIEVVFGTLDACLNQVRDRRFDCVLVTNLIHLLPEPDAILRRLAGLVAAGGTLVLEAHNFQHLPVLVRRALRAERYREIGRFETSGLQIRSAAAIGRTIRRAGLDVTALRWCDPVWPRPVRRAARWAGRFGATTWILQARRPSAVRQTVMGPVPHAGEPPRSPCLPEGNVLVQ